MDEDSWIEYRKALQLNIPETITSHFPLHITQISRVQDIVEEYLGLQDGQPGIWI